jgi:glycerate kinase
MEHATALAKADEKGISDVVAKTMVAEAAIAAGGKNTTISFLDPTKGRKRLHELQQAFGMKS